MLAHELTHVIQQSDHRVERLQRQVSPASAHLQSPRFSPSAKLERCFEDTDRLGQGDPDTDAVKRIQQALIDVQAITGNTYDLGSSGTNNDGVDGNYGPKTAAAVKKFKADENLGFTEFGDVGPGTMHRLDQLFASEGTPPAPTPPATAPTAAPTPAAPINAQTVIFFELPTQKFMGYDGSVVPNELVVPLGGEREAGALVAPFPAQATFISIDPSIAEVVLTANGILVKGKTDGLTRIEAVDGGAVLATLFVIVKASRNVTVDFHLTSDKATPPHHTTRSASDADTLIATLNRVWELQANIHFAKGVVDHKTVPKPLGEVVTDPDRFDFVILATGGDWNVFLVWEYEPFVAEPFPGFTPEDIPGVTAVAPGFPTITLLEDHPCPDGLTLAHEAGHFFFLKLERPSGIMSPCPIRESPRVTRDEADIANP